MLTSIIKPFAFIYCYLYQCLKRNNPNHMELLYSSASLIIALIVYLALAFIMFVLGVNVVSIFSMGNRQYDHIVHWIIAVVYLYFMSVYIKRHHEQLLSYYKDIDLLNARNTLKVLLLFLGLIGLIILLSHPQSHSWLVDSVSGIECFLD